MIISASQPTYLPWIRYFAMIDSCDTFLCLDSFQMVNSSFHRRNRIKNLQDEEIWLTVPVGRQNLTLLNKTIITNFELVKKHLFIFEENYHHTPFFNETYQWFKEVLDNKFNSLSHFTTSLIVSLCERMGVETPIILTSQMDYEKTLKKDKLIVSLVKMVGGTSYRANWGSSSYIEKETPGGFFPSQGLELSYFNYEHPLYLQRGEGFMPYLCILDLLSNIGFKKALSLIRSGIRESFNYRFYRKEIMKLED